MYLGNVMLLVLNLPLIGLWVQVLRVPYRILFPLILLFCLIGVYSVSNSIFDIYVMIGFGAVGYLMKKFDYEGAPLVLAFVLGPLLENNLRKSLILSQGDFAIFVTRPLSAACLVARGPAPGLPAPAGPRRAPPRRRRRRSQLDRALPTRDRPNLGRRHPAGTMKPVPTYGQRGPPFGTGCLGKARPWSAIRRGDAGSLAADDHRPRVFAAVAWPCGKSVAAVASSRSSGTGSRRSPRWRWSSSVLAGLVSRYLRVGGKSGGDHRPPAVIAGRREPTGRGLARGAGGRPSHRPYARRRCRPVAGRLPALPARAL